MRITPQIIILLQSLKGFGNATVRGIVNKLSACETCSLSLLYELIGEMVASKALRVQLPTIEDLKKAQEYAESIVLKSDNEGVKMLTFLDPEFPKRFHKTVSETGKSDIPLIIHCKGNLSILDASALTIIGTREPNNDGMRAAEYFSSEFAKNGINIVSGLALGCDTIAHRGALSVGGATTAILAGGLDAIYPKENLLLAESILQSGGLLISENPIFTSTNKYNLVARDRLQAALGDATLVIQTSVKGGTMHAAKATLSAGKPLFVVDYKDSTADVVQGNLLLKGQGAIGLSSLQWKENPEFFIGKLSSL